MLAGHPALAGTRPQGLPPLLKSKRNDDVHIPTRTSSHYPWKMSLHIYFLSILSYLAVNATASKHGSTLIIKIYFVSALHFLEALGFLSISFLL